MKRTGSFFYVILIGTLLLGFLSLSGISTAGNTDPTLESILSGLEKKYAGKSFEVQFSQTTRLAALDIVKQASGKAVFSHPGKMYWEYKQPEAIKYITNGRTLWIFRPEESQVMIAGADTFFKSGAGGSFLSNISRMRQDNDIRIKKISDSFIELELVPKIKSDDISSIIIQISRKTNEISRVVTYNAYDDTTQFEFFNPRFKAVDKNMFTFTVPEGINVIHME